MTLAASLRAELQSVAPDLLDEPAAAEYYGQVAESAARAHGVKSDLPLRVAVAATLLEWAITAHGEAPDVDAGTLLMADLRLALAAEIAAEVREPRVQAALSRAIMEMAVGIAEQPLGLATDPRPVLAELVGASAAIVGQGM
ncbi:MAG: hypothetical protein ACYDGR_09390 [Candidatus Dormibacteria bacterium]